MRHLLRLTQILAIQLFCAATANCQTQPPPARLEGPSQSLNAEQLATVKLLLAKYKPTSLTTEDAKVIKRSLRDAGMKRSQALDVAMRNAGFSVEKIDALDPPPPPADGAPPASH